MFNDPSATGSEAITAAAAPATSSGPALVIDLNFLPERYRRRKLTLKLLRPAMFLLGFSLLLIPLAQYWTGARDRLLVIEAAFQRVQSELQDYQPVAEERTRLEARIEAARAASQEIQTAYDTVNIQKVTWSRLVGRSLIAVPSGIELSRLSQASEEIVFEGTSETYALPSKFADNLRGLGDYAEVTIQSITRMEPAEAEALIEPEEGSEGEQVPAEQAQVPPTYRFEIRAVLLVEAEPEPAPQEGE